MNILDTTTDIEKAATIGSSAKQALTDFGTRATSVTNQLANALAGKMTGTVNTPGKMPQKVNIAVDPKLIEQVIGASVVTKLSRVAEIIMKAQVDIADVLEASDAPESAS